MATPVTALQLSAWNVQKSVSVLKTSAWNVGTGLQANMTQMATIPWASTYPS